MIITQHWERQQLSVTCPKSIKGASKREIKKPFIHNELRIHFHLLHIIIGSGLC